MWLHLLRTLGTLRLATDLRNHGRGLCEQRRTVPLSDDHSICQLIEVSHQNPLLEFSPLTIFGRYASSDDRVIEVEEVSAVEWPIPVRGVVWDVTSALF